MRALRDFNTPKIVTDDVAIFMGLIGDLFPALDVPRKRDPELEETVKNAMMVCLTTGHLSLSLPPQLLPLFLLQLLSLPLPLNCSLSLPHSLQAQGLQPEELFVLKVVQLEELLHVRHSVFVIGNAGTGTDYKQHTHTHLLQLIHIMYM